MSRLYKDSVKESITPDFSYDPNITKNNHKNNNQDLSKTQLQSYESSASRTTSIGSQKSPKNLENHIPYNPSAPKKSKKKNAPLIFILSALIGAVGAMIFFAAQLGFHLQELITINTSRDYGNYQVLSRSTIRQVLSGKYPLKDSFKDSLEKQGFTIIEKDVGYDLHYKNTLINDSNFDNLVKNDPEFRDAITKAKRGRAANFFDDKAAALYQKLGISRNVLKNYKQTDNPELDAKNYKTTYSDQFSENSDTRLNTAEDHTTTDEDGNEITERVSSGEEINTRSIDGDTPEAKATSFIQSTSNRVAKGLSTAEVGCAVQKIGTMVSIAVSTYEMYQTIHQFMFEMESVSKTMLGEGKHAALNSQNNEWVKEVTTSYVDVDTGEEKTVTGAPIEAEGIKLSVSSEAANKSKVKNYSTERSLLATFSVINTNHFSTTACSTVSAANAVVSLATLATPGSGFIKIAIGALKQVAVSATIQIAIGALISSLVPIVAQALFTNPAELTGIPHGEQIAKGASSSAYLTATANSAFTPASKERVLAANKVNQTILAQEAEEDRLNRSPFDASSPNTFLGSLALKIAPLSNNKNILSGIIKFSNLTTSSLFLKTFASGENSDYLSTFGECPTAEEFNMASDIYCIPTTASDPSTADLEDDDPTYQAWLTNNITVDSNGNQSVIPGSFLAEFLELVAGRESLPGNYDAGIADRALEYITGNATSTLENIPYISDVLELVNFANNEEVDAWARGTICINSSDNPRWDSDCKYAQHYIQKSRILNQIGYYEGASDPIASFQSTSSYLNPTDTSRIAVFSRMTGLTHDDAEFTLALLDYTSYLASYHPENTYPFTDNDKCNRFKHQSVIFLKACGDYDQAQATKPYDNERESRDPRNMLIEVARINYIYYEDRGNTRGYLRNLAGGLA